MSLRKDRFFATTIASLWVLTPLVLLVIGYLVSVRIPMSEAVRTWAAAEEAPKTLSMPVEIALTWRPQAALRAPVWDGTVQKVYVQPGGTLRSGDKVVRVNGIDRLAVFSAEPFWRPITQGSQGSDVQQLNDVLGGLGLAHGNGTTADGLTAQGISELAVTLGAGEARTFEPGWVLFLSAPSLKVADVKIEAASAVPPAGSEVVAASSALMAATVIEKGSLERSSQPGAGQEPATPGATAENGPGATGEVGSGGAAPSGTAVLVPTQAELVSAGISLKVTSDRKTGRSTVDPAGLEVLKKQAQTGAESLAATIDAPSSAGSVDVPGSALWTDRSGSRCVAVKQTDGSAKPISVQLLAGIGGRAVITGSIRPGDQVLVSVQDRLPCA